MELDSQRIVILGGTSGIGLATAQLAAAEGATVVVASSNPERVDAALANLPVSAEGYATRPLDLAPEANATALDSRTARRTSAFRFLRSGAVGVAWMQPSAGEVSPCKPPPVIEAR